MGGEGTGEKGWPSGERRGKCQGGSVAMPRGPGQMPSATGVEEEKRRSQSVHPSAATVFQKHLSVIGNLKSCAHRPIY